MSIDTNTSSHRRMPRFGLQGCTCLGILLVAAIGLLTLQDQVTVFDFGDPGPDARFFPRLVLWLLALGAVLRLWRHRRTAETAIGPAVGWIRVLFVMMLMAVALATMPMLGFIITVATIGIVLAWLLGERHWLFNVALPLIVTIAIFWAGRHLLNLPLP
ncbi:tripartite tricarboxylate transporter TctB family protein [Larsenimonas rhizosphaerae]|uniref:Tripartite tricarboxylate transporter TctB family protein n=1 Tax=Larsenimonas rhizosphaerae TaxID=2944682 RepID=A0AA41ZDP6_9GAMM|nr:tripartite tricarboxylate transporter TctB family protein [Larsenimonas rhizosphaerae]MCX2522927.1 tripartite tricarboxylate transporter TctB family protein [Larsenimonas rhizosphaerae]